MSKEALMIVNKWWDTVRKDGTLVDLTPSEENRAMIPFLQMANGGTNKLGCAYHLCNDADGSVDAYILFVCTYGDPHIKVGSPIYTEGPPCDSCKDRCLHGALCDTEIA
ncbi:hypothetical protein DICVIV_10148 [Dictyocaulus viviparus]|uniref:SCP domain-containing protein n=1 Tax=Dictyocaulus viviparus TaxID=29172 RepID=A0A0D8XGW8_DICVI|nr:hypothetical protein DICVIV_10148 [Dictyocaulus viviparus]